MRLRWDSTESGPVEDGGFFLTTMLNEKREAERCGLVTRCLQGIPVGSAKLPRDNFQAGAMR